MNAYPSVEVQNCGQREAILGGLKRFHGKSPMIYRTNVLFHTRKVLGLVDDLLPLLQSDYPLPLNVSLARAIAVIHDDTEMIKGEETSKHKERLSLEEISALQMERKREIFSLSQRYNQGSINGFVYGHLLFLACEQKKAEAQLVAFADKLDGFGEALHEVYAGNPHFLEAANTYVERIQRFIQEHEHLASLMETKILPTRQNLARILIHGNPHTSDSIHQDTGYYPYEFWRRSVEGRFGEEGLAYLVTAKEKANPISFD
ncbi:hypothetical protein HZA98_04275 [Candidatus Woesearchaeota archaeon]|nr:hypothetical protein [Candidatus Woesearchaeota archaeon]